MSLLINPYRFVPAGVVLPTATAWWVAKQASGGDLVDQSGNGRTMVANGSPAYANDGTHHIAQLRAADSDNFSAADNALLDADTGDFTAVIVTKPQVNLTGSKILWAKREAAALGWNLFTNGATPTGTYDDDVAAAVQATGANLSTGTRYTLAVVKSGTTWRVVVDGTAGTPQTVSTNTIANAQAMRLSRGSGATTNYSDQDLYGAAWFKGIALADADTVTAGTELLAADLL